MKFVTCNNCNWVHFEVPRMHAEQDVLRFNEYFMSLSDKERQDFYGDKGADISLYDSCHRCNGSYKNFRDSVEGDCPIGCTIGPIIDRNE
jgi:hypothetical protein